jgi:predicted nucleotide-binding protein
MEKEYFIETLQEYKLKLENILKRFNHDDDTISINSEDEPFYKQTVIEVNDLLSKVKETKHYMKMIVDEYNEGRMNFYNSPSYNSVRNIIGIINAAITRFQREQEIYNVKIIKESSIRQNSVFIIHGSEEAKWRELKDLLKTEFHLNPIILKEQPEKGKTLIEKFEYYADTCSYAIAIFTPDDEVIDNNQEKYLQARPNVIYELGWFCGKLGRQNVMLLLKEGTSIFSDFSGIVQKRFHKEVAEKILEIRNELVGCGIMNNNQFS